VTKVITRVVITRVMLQSEPKVVALDR